MKLSVNAPLRYLIIAASTPFQDDDRIALSEMMRGLIGHCDQISDASFFVVFYDCLDAIKPLELLENITSEYLIDVRLYMSDSFPSKEDAFSHYIFTRNALQKIAFPSSERVFNDKILMRKLVFQGVDESMKRHVFGEIYDDQAFLNTVKVFLAQSQNTSKAAKLLFMHRNTLINKLEKFEQLTGYNLKKFEDAIVIYGLLQD